MGTKNGDIWVGWGQTAAKRLTLLLLGALLLQLSPSTFAKVDLELEIVGVEGELLDNVLAYLNLEQRQDEEELNERWLKVLHQDAPAEIRAALVPYGYYNVEVEGSLEQVDGRWIARYVVNPGEQVRIRTLDLRYIGEGADMAELADAISAWPLKVGDTLDHELYEQAKSALVSAAQTLGYASATPAIMSVAVAPERNAADITVHVDTGPRYYIGEVRFHQDFLDPELLEKTVTLERGALYQNEDVLAFQQGLQVTDWASVVTVAPDFNAAVDGQVPLDVTLKPNRRNRYSFGVGYETDVGVRVSARWVQRRINSAGHHAEAYTRLSPVRRTARAAYYIPVRQPITDRFAGTAEYEYEETSDTRRNTLDGKLGFVRRSIDDRSFSKAFVELRSEEYEISGQPSTQTDLLSVGFAQRFTELAREPFPQRGRYFEYELRGASSQVYSDTSYARLYVNTKFLLPLASNGRFRLTGEFGFAEVEDFELYPTSLRFFAGGDSSIRGYTYKSLGPEDDDGNVVGGENLAVVSAEYDHRILPQWVLAAFVDGGNAYNDKLDDINVGAGVGFRWVMDFGSLRVDLAWPVSDDDVEFGDVMLHLGFGAAL